jgi:hypothetical protein
MAQKLVMKITGMGDYKVSSNSLYAGSILKSSPPVFGQYGHSTRLAHREYLCEVQTSNPFTQLIRQEINPSNDALFPWLSKLSQNFEQFRFHGLVFEFVSTSGDAVSSTNSALGAVIMATQYDPYQPPFASKVQADSYEFAVSTKPSTSAIHPIECDPRVSGRDVYYMTDTNTVGSQGDLRMTVLGMFNLLTSGSQAAFTAGELWVSYDVELIKPRLLGQSIGDGQQMSVSLFRNGQWSTGGPGIAATSYSVSDWFVAATPPLATTTLYGSLPFVNAAGATVGYSSGRLNTAPLPSISKYGSTFGNVNSGYRVFQFPSTVRGVFRLQLTYSSSGATTTTGAPPFILGGALTGAVENSIAISGGALVRTATSFNGANSSSYFSNYTDFGLVPGYAFTHCFIETVTFLLRGNGGSNDVNGLTGQWIALPTTVGYDNSIRPVSGSWALNLSLEQIFPDVAGLVLVN